MSARSRFIVNLATGAVKRRNPVDVTAAGKFDYFKFCAKYYRLCHVEYL